MSEPLIWKVVCNGDAENVEKLLIAGANANMCGPNYLSLLHTACFKGYAQIAKILINAGANVNAGSLEAGSPLHCACAEGWVDIVNLLLDSGAIINERAESGTIPLETAILYGHEAVVEVLLSRGAREWHLDQFWQPCFLRLACLVGNVGIARLLIKSGANVNEKDCCGVTALSIAIQQRNKRLAEVLIDEGADLNEKIGESSYYLVNMERKLLTWEATHCWRRSESDFTRAKESNFFAPFTLADHKGDDEMMRLLVERGARVVLNDPDKSMTPLHYACQKGYTELATFLIESGANVNEINARSETPLHIACKGGRLGLIQILTQYKADLEAKTSYGYTPYTLAWRYNRLDSIQYLIDAGVKIDGPEHATKLLYGAYVAGNIDRMEKILKAGANVDFEYCSRTSPNLLHLTTNLNQQEIMKCLIESGADVNKSDEIKRTPLHKHCQAGRADTVELLLESGARVSAPDKNGDSPLHIVDGLEKEEIVKLLLNRGAEVDRQNRFGETPLHSHCWKGNVEVVRLLLAAGADIKKRDNIQLTPLCSVFRKIPFSDEDDVQKRVEIIKVLLSSGASVNERDGQNMTPMDLVCNAPHESLLEILLHSGVDVNKKLESNQTPIHQVLTTLEKYYTRRPVEGDGLRSRHIKAIKVLVEHGADIDGADKDGKIFLHHACKRGDTEFVKVLLEGGANPNKLDHSGMSPLHYARKNKKDWLMKYLLQKGADVNIQDALGNTALHYVTYPDEDDLYQEIEEDDSYCVIINRGYGTDQIHCLKMLVQAGANVNLKNKLGRLPLLEHISDEDYGRKYDLESSRILLEAGTDITLLNIDGEFLNSQWQRRVTLLLDYGVGDLACGCEKCTNNTSVMMCAFNQAQHDASALLRHAIKVRAAELDAPKLVGEDLSLKGNEGDTNFSELCENEVSTMKTESIGDSGFTYYDLLRCQNPSVLRGKGLPWSLTSDTCLQKFPIYGDMLYSRLAPVKKKLILDHCSRLFELTDLPRLAPHCVRAIFENLSFSDWLNVANACDIYYRFDS